MRRHVMLLLALTVSAVLLLEAGCQRPAEITEEPKPAPVQSEPTVQQQKVEPAKPTPKIAFQKVIHDYGKVGPGTSNVGEFRFTNQGDALLLITGVKDCCGIKTSLQKRQYASGESGVLRARWQAYSTPATMRRQVYVYSNDPCRPQVTLTLKGQVVPKVAYQPTSLRLLLKDDQADGPEITLTSLDGKTFSIRQFRASGDCVTADFDPAVQATKFVLKAKVDAQKLQRGAATGTSGRIYIGLTHPECGEISIPFSALPRFKITPPQIIVLKAKPETPVVRRLWVLSNYGEDFEIESTSSQNNLVKVLGQKEVGSGYEFEVEITPPDAQDRRRFNDAFVVNLAGGEKLTIMCRGFY